MKRKLYAGVAMLGLCLGTGVEAGGVYRAVYVNHGAGAQQNLLRVAGAAGARVHRGPNGGGAAVRGIRGDGQGNVQGGHGRVYQRPNGGAGYRGAQFEKNADGSLSRNAQGHRETPKGTVDRSSSFHRDAEGNTSYQRSITATGQGGNTIQADVVRENGQVSRSVTCNGGPCPQQGDAQ